VILFDRRASAVLSNVLRTRADPRPFLMPANACPILPQTFAEVGQPLELVDIAEPWLEIDATACSELLRANPTGYAGLLFIHPYGSERDATTFFGELKSIQPDLFIIDDKCLCRPDLDGDLLSPLADLTLFSTGHTKYADVDGGGFAHTIAADCKGNAPKGDYRRRVTEATRTADEQKELLNAIYTRLLPADVQLREELQRWRFNIRVPDAERLLETIFASGLFASRHYASLGDFAVAARLHTGIVNLFNDRYFDVDRARRVSELVLRHLETTASQAHPRRRPPEG
jgi:hypothetical protein